MKTFILVLLLATTGCHSRALRYTNYVGTALMAGSIACDWGQTNYAATYGWDDLEMKEANPILGESPTPNQVNAYMAAATIVLVVGTHFLPDWLQPAVYSTVIVKQSMSIVGNHAVGLPLCGVGGASRETHP